LVSLYLSARVPAGDLISAALFGFAALSWVLAVLLPRSGSERARIWVIVAPEAFITLLGLAIFGTWVFALVEHDPAVGVDAAAGGDRPGGQRRRGAAGLLRHGPRSSVRPAQP
jgi:hypothetical protein